MAKRPNKPRQQPIKEVMLEEALDRIRNRMELKELYQQLTLNLQKQEELKNQLGITEVLIKTMDETIRKKL